MRDLRYDLIIFRIVDLLNWEVNYFVDRQVEVSLMSFLLNENVTPKKEKKPIDYLYTILILPSQVCILWRNQRL